MNLLSVPSKFIGRHFLNRIHDHLFYTQPSEQAGLMPKISTIDRILGLWVLIERRLEYRQGFLAAYVDIKKVLLSVDR